MVGAEPAPRMCRDRQVGTRFRSPTGGGGGGRGGVTRRTSRADVIRHPRADIQILCRRRILQRLQIQTPEETIITLM